MDTKLLVSKQWKALVLQVVGLVTTAHWCIVCFIVASGRIQESYSLRLSPLCIVSLLDRHKHCLVILCHSNSCERALWQLKWMPSLLFLFSLIRVWLSPVAGDSGGTCGDPGTPAHASREAGNFKVRSKVRLTCAVGHTLYGSAERICFPNGTWSGRQPFCKRKGKLKKLLCDVMYENCGKGVKLNYTHTHTLETHTVLQGNVFWLWTGYQASIGFFCTEWTRPDTRVCRTQSSHWRLRRVLFSIVNLI